MVENIFPSIHIIGQHRCERGTDPKTVPRFVPRQRFAVLANLWTEACIPRRQIKKRGWCHAGERQVFLLEALFTDWRFSFGPQVDSVLDGYFGRQREEFREGINMYRSGQYIEVVDRLAGGDEELAFTARAAIVEIENAYADLPFVRRQPYDCVIKIPPYSAMPKNFRVAAASLFPQATAQALTCFFVSGHGGQKGVAGRTNLAYKRMFDELGRIPGKKLVIALACHAGVLVEYLKNRPDREDFLVIASAGIGEEGSNWGNDSILKELARQIAWRRWVSSFRLSPYVFSGFHQTPEIFGYFDVKI
jgi:hypothetical protein